MTTLEQSLSEILNFSLVHEHLLSSGQPSAAQLQHIKEYGCSTVINLALNDASPRLEHEDRICLELGLNYIQLPILWEMPAADQCLLALDLIDHLVPNEIVWVHCAKNYRVSCLMSLYRQYFMGIDSESAHEILHQIWEPNETWTGLMHSVSLQLQGRVATQDLQRSLIDPNQFI